MFRSWPDVCARILRRVMRSPRDPGAAVSASLVRRFLQLAIPVSLQSMVGALYGVVDMYMVGHLGASAVAAVGLASSFVGVLFLVLVALGSGVGVLAAQYHGRGSAEGVRQVTAQGVLLSLACCLPLIALFVWKADGLMALASSDPQLVRQGAPFLAVVAVSILCPAITIPFESSLRAAGVVLLPAVLGMACIPLNALLNYLLIFGWGPIPALGVLGSALGTLLVRVLHLIVLLGLCYWRHLPARVGRADLRQALQRSPVRHFMSIAVPLLVHDVLWALGMIVYNLVFARSGVTALAAFSQLGVIESVLICAFVGCSVACSTLLGQSLGRGRLQEAWQQARALLCTCLGLALAGGLLLWLCSAPLAHWSSRLQGEALSFYLYGLQVLGLTLFIRILNMVGIVGVLRSGADTRATIVIDLVGMWLVGLPLAALGILYWQWPFALLYLIPVAQEVIKLLMTLWRIRQRAWLRNLVPLTTHS